MVSYFQSESKRGPFHSTLGFVGLIQFLGLWGTKTYIAVCLESSFVSLKNEVGKAIIG